MKLHLPSFLRRALLLSLFATPLCANATTIYNTRLVYNSNPNLGAVLITNLGSFEITGVPGSGEGICGWDISHNIRMTGNGDINIHHNSPISNDKGLIRGGLFYGVWDLSSNGNVTVESNSIVANTAIYGGVFNARRSFNISNNGNLVFQDNAVTSTGTDGFESGEVVGGVLRYHGAYDHSAYDGDNQVKNNGDITFSGNTIESKHRYAAGAAVGGGRFTFSENANLLFSKNIAVAGTYAYGGAISLSDYDGLLLKDNTGNITFTGNGTNGTTEANGGAIGSRSTAPGTAPQFQGNQNISFTLNYTNAGNEATKARAHGGALYTSNKTSSFSDNGKIEFSGNYASGTEHAGGGAIAGSVTFSGNEEVKFTANHVDAPSTRGGALGRIEYSKTHIAGNITFSDNDYVEFRGNYETNGSEYLLRSIYADKMTLSAGTGGIALYDSFYCVGTLNINTNGSSSSVILSGKYIEQDLVALKPGHTQNELDNSLSSFAQKVVITGGLFQIEDQAVLSYKNLEATNAGTLSLKNGHILQTGTGYYENALFYAGATLKLQGVNTYKAVSKSLYLYDKSKLHFVVGAENISTPVLSVTGGMRLDKYLGLTLSSHSLLATGKYLLLDHTTYTGTGIPSFMNTLTVSGLDSDLSSLTWESNKLYLNYIAPGDPSGNLTWESNQNLNGSPFADGNSVTIDYMGTIQVVGTVRPDSVQINDKFNITLTGDNINGNLLTKDGEGTLLVKNTADFVNGTHLNAGLLVIASEGTIGGGINHQGGMLRVDGGIISGNYVQTTDGLSVNMNQATIDGNATFYEDSSLSLNAENSISGNADFGNGCILSLAKQEDGTLSSLVIGGQADLGDLVTFDLSPDIDFNSVYTLLSADSLTADTGSLKVLLGGESLSKRISSSFNTDEGTLTLSFIKNNAAITWDGQEGNWFGNNWTLDSDASNDSFINGDSVTLKNGDGKIISLAGANVKAASLSMESAHYILEGHSATLEGTSESSSWNQVNSNIILSGVNARFDNGYAIDNKSALTIANGSKLQGDINNEGLIRLDDQTGKEHSFHNLLNNGRVDFVNVGRTLTVDNLSGNGSFRMDTDLAAGITDKLVVTGNLSGQHTLDITAVGDLNAITPDSRVTLAEVHGTVESGASIEGSFSAGMWDVTLTPVSMAGNAGTEWQTAISGFGNAAAPILNTAGAMSTGWFNQLDSLHKRMGELRLTPKCSMEGNLWVRTYGSQNNTDLGIAGLQNFREFQYGFDLGVDKVITLANGNYLSYGLFSGYQTSDRDFRDPFGSDGKTDSFYGGLYSTYTTQDGWYLDLVSKAQSFSNEIDIKGLYPDKAEFDTWGLGLSVEGGKQFTLDDNFFIEPSVQASWLHMGGKSYTSDRGIDVNTESANVYRLAAFLRTGKTIKLGAGGNPHILQPYVKAGVMDQMSSGGSLSSSGGSWRPNTDGVNGILGAGLIWQMQRCGQIHVDYSASIGEKVTIPWNVNVGYRMSF